MHERTGQATKGALANDKPTLLGRIVSPQVMSDFRSGPHARKATAGVLACAEVWRLFGLHEVSDNTVLSPDLISASLSRKLNTPS